MKKSFILGALAIGLMAFTFGSNTPNNSTPTSVSDIKFKQLSLSDAKALAKEEGKLIFIDCHTSWCGPCKKMAATSFKDEEVTQVFNEKFINLKIDIEKDADGPEIARLYKIKAYPTLLVINANGKLVKERVGFMTADQMVAFANSVD
ncbi:MAG: thioredoxin family protein [Bacteroidota bacterium]